MLSRLTEAVVSSVGAKIMFLVFAAVAVTALCSGIFIVQTRANIQAEVFRNQSALAQTYAGLVDEFLRGARGDIEAAAALPTIRGPLNLSLKDPALHGIPPDAEPQRRADLAASGQSSDRLVSLLLITPQGEPYALEPYTRQQKFRDDSVASQPYFQRVAATGLTAWSDVFSADLGFGEVPTVVVAVPIKTDSGEIRSVLSGPIALAALGVAAQKIPHGQTGQLMLFDSQGVPIVYPDSAVVEAMDPLLEHPLIAAALSQQTESLAYHNPLNGQDELGTAVPLDNGWFAVVTQSQAEAFDGLNRTVTTLLAVLTTGVVILLAADLFLARSVARGIGAVSRAAIGLASGDLDQEVDVWSRDEVGRMAASFRKMIAYHRRMAAIADAVARGDLTSEVRPQSSRDRLGIALAGMTGNLRRLVSRLEQLAFHDPLTGLANRALFLNHLHAALERLEDQPVGVLFLDVDNFKVVNDSLGHVVGDELLTALAGRLQLCIRQGDVVARLGGDEFTILLSDLPDPDAAMAMAERIAAQLREPVYVGEHSLVVSVSIGIALGSAGHDSPGDLLRAADLALYAAKDAGKARAIVFEAAMDADTLRRLELDFTGDQDAQAA